MLIKQVANEGRDVIIDLLEEKSNVQLVCGPRRTLSIIALGFLLPL